MTARQQRVKMRKVKRDKATIFVKKYHTEGYEPKKILGQVWDIWGITGEYIDGMYTLQIGWVRDGNVMRWTFAA